MAGKKPRSEQKMVGVLANHVEQRTYEITNIYTGSALDHGIYTYPEWVRKGRDEEWRQARAADISQGQHAIERPYEDQACARFDAWVCQNRKTLEIVPVLGKHGTGLTWCLLRVAKAIHDRNTDAKVLIVDDPINFSATQLHAVLPASEPVVLVIDEADEQRAIRPLCGAQNLPVFAICGTSSAVFAATLALTSTGHAHEEIQLPFWPQSYEMRKLKAAFGYPVLSSARRKLLRRGTIRSAARILGNGEEIGEVARRVALAAQKDDTGSLALLVETTARGTQIPQSLALRAVISARLSEACQAWTQQREYLEPDGSVGRLLWIEDQETAGEAEVLIAKLEGLDQISVSNLRCRLVANLIDKASKSSYAGEADFVRRLLASLAPAEAKHLVGADPRSISLLVERSNSFEATLSWIKLLARLEIPVGQLCPRLRFETQDSFADILVMASEFDDQDLADAMLDRLKSLPNWDVKNWTFLFELMQHIPKSAARVVLISLIPILSRQPSPEGIIGAGNSLQILLPIAAASGDARTRDWLWINALKSGPPIHAAHHFFELTRRCTTQSRSELALRILGNASRNVETDRATDLYDSLLENERISARCRSAATWCEKLLTHPGIKASSLASAHAELTIFSKIWVPSQFFEYWSMSCKFLHDKPTGTPLRVLGRLRWAVAHTMRGLTEHDIVSALSVVLAGSHWANVSDSEAQCYLKVMASLASVEGDFCELAQEALLALFINTGGSLASKLSEYKSALREHVPELETPSRVFRLNSTERRLAAILTPYLTALPEDVQEAAFRSAYVRWGNGGPTRNPLAYAAMRLGVISEFWDLLEPEGSPNDQMMTAAAYASVGSIIKSREYLGRAVDGYRLSGAGAHLHTTHKCASVLASQSDEDWKNTYSLAAGLVCMGPLLPRRG